MQLKLQSTVDCLDAPERSRNERSVLFLSPAKSRWARLTE
jgi:hypothetical protein